jgi:homoserine O-succinyltransferase
MRNETIAIHAGYEPDPSTKSVAVPIYQIVAYAFDSADHGAALFNLETEGFRIEREYRDIAELDRLNIDGLIVTGAEPIAPTLPEETYWPEFVDLVEWAKANTRSTIWSCLAAHAAVSHLGGIERQRLPRKCSGVYDCGKVIDHDLLRDLPRSIRISHSRYNEVRQSDLLAHGFSILTYSEQAGVAIFARDDDSRFIFFQGHPEYDALSLQREYMRDIARFLAGERDQYPDIPRLLLRA